MATYLVNKRAVAKARELIDARQYRMRSRWAEIQPRAAEQNAFLKAHGWAEHASWHLALTDGLTIAPVQGTARISTRKTRVVRYGSPRSGSAVHRQLS